MNHEAIYALYPVVVSVDGQGVAWDANGSAVAYDILAVNAWVDPVAYIAKRAAAYPPIGDQLDALFHAGIFPAEMAAKLAEVKARFPK